MTAGSNNQLQGGYVYDAAGNMTHDATANLNYSFDHENRITGAGGYTYTYDGDGNRVEKTNGSTGTLYWYMSPGIVAESDLTGNLQSEYVFFNGERVARRDNPTGANSTIAYYFSDHLKTTDIVTDALGNIKNESDFYPWGGELQFLANDSNHYKFTGKERDTETGLDDFEARYYSNGLGRFVTPDFEALPSPVPWADFENPQSLNLFRYAGDNPTTFGDDGHDCVVQTRTGDKTESVSVSTGTCDGVKVGDGQSKTYVPGTTDVSRIHAGADGRSIDIGYTPYDGGGTGVQNAAAAPYPDNPGLAYGLNQDAYRTLTQASMTVDRIAVATGVVVGANGIAMLAGPTADFLASQAYQRALQAWNAYKGTGQARLLAQYFKTGVLPLGLTTEAVAAYLALAKAYVAAGKGFVEGMAVQSQRIQQLETLLKSMGK